MQIYQMILEKLTLKNLKLYKGCMGSLTFLQPINFKVSTIGACILLAIACKKLKIAWQLLNFICAYSDTFYGLKDVNNYVSKDLPIATNFDICINKMIYVLYCITAGMSPDLRRLIVWMMNPLPQHRFVTVK